MKPANHLFANVPTTIFTIMSVLASEQNAINLGQGFPDTDGPLWIRQAAAKYILEGPNQYPPMKGIPDLCHAVSSANKRFYSLDIDPSSEVIVTAGATEALADCMLGLLNIGDEAIVLEPFYDSYVPQIQAAGGIPKYVRLHAPNWALNEDALRSAFSKKTKLLILNSPMNPAAKVFNRNELEIIAKLLIEFDAYAVCDEVYEHLIFDGLKHIPLMKIKGMRDRCLRIGSAGKTFSFTGWKIGYISGPEHLIKPVMGVHQFLTFTVPPALQKAVAEGILTDDTYYQDLINDMSIGRKLLADGLKNIGFKVLPCEGTYFLTADFSPIGYEGNDIEFCKWITSKAKVAAIPMSPFYSTENGPPPRTLVRFCFAKKQDILEKAIENLTKFFL